MSKPNVKGKLSLLDSFGFNKAFDGVSNVLHLN